MLLFCDLIRRNRELEWRLEAVYAALDPNQTKHAYIGEVTTPACHRRKDKIVVIDWTTTKAIMEMIRNRAQYNENTRRV